MKNIKVFALPLLVSSLFAQQNVAVQTQPVQQQAVVQNANPPVYPANAGAAVQQNISTTQQQNAQATPVIQMKDFGVSVFVNEGNKLVKRDLSADSLKKAAVIFFGDWCPNCHKFLTDSSDYLNALANSGVKVILVHVPSADKLRNWQDPTVQEYDGVKQKVASYVIGLSKNVEVVLLGERTALSKIGITGLPVFIAVKDSKEFRREVGTSGAAQLQDDNVRTQLMNTWQAGDKNAVASSNNANNNKQASKKTQKSSKKVVGAINNDSHPKLSKEKMIQAKTATEMLNSSSWHSGNYSHDLNASVGYENNYTKKLNSLR